MSNGPPPEAVDLGHDVFYTKGLTRSGQWVSIQEWHRDPAGNWCAGYVPFDVEHEWRTPADAWQVVQWEPLTLSPSLLCRACQHHGFIRDGRWIPA